MTTSADASVFAVVGGGRWARVFLSVMAGFDFPYRVVVVSSANGAVLADMAHGTAGPIELVPTIECLPRCGRVVAALVVNAAASHADTACRLLELGASVLVEKPLALCPEEVERMYGRASSLGLLVMPALTFLHCSYLVNFARVIRDLNAGPPLRLSLDWHDPVNERRYGEVKSYDPGISLPQDVMPHVWAILAVVLEQPEARVDVLRCEAERGGRSASYLLSFGGTPCNVQLQRESGKRRRQVALEWASGASATLDFTREPGTITTAAQSFSADPDWEHGMRPVRRQLNEFLAALGRAPAASPWHGVAARSTALTARANDLLKQEQIALLRGSPRTAWSDDVAYAVGEILAPRLLAGHQVAAGDRPALQAWLAVAVRAIESGSPAGDWYGALETLDAAAITASNQMEAQRPP